MDKVKNSIESLSTGQKIAGSGACLALIGSILPWATIPQGGSRPGISSLDGIFVVLIVGILLALFTYREYPYRGVPIGGVLVLFVGLYDIVFPLDMSMLGVSVSPEFIRPGIGIYLTALGGFLMLSSAVFQNRST